MKSKYYDNKMIELITFIQEAYKNAFLIDSEEGMPDMLRIEVEVKKRLLFFKSKKTKAKNPPSVTRFQAEYWRKKISDDSILRPRIWKIICMICDYENDHLYERSLFTDNHISDPSMLVLEIIKHKLCEIKNEISNLKTMSGRGGLLSQLINFLGILEVSDRFPQNSSQNKISRMEIFIRVRAELENLKSEICLYLNNSCAYEDMKVVMDNSKQLLSLGIECLHYSLRSHESLQESSVQSLRNPSNNRLREMMNFKMGEVMQELLNTPVFLTLYPDDIKSSELMNQIPQTIFPIDISELGKNENLKAKLNILLNSKESVTGVQNGCNNIKVLQTYILLHGLLEEMGRCIVGCEHAFASAKAGGDMLVYGLINEPVSEITGNFIEYINDTAQLFQNFYRSLDDIYFQFARAKDLDGVKPWVKNFNKSRAIFSSYTESTEITLEALVKVKSKAQRGIDSEKMQKIASNLKCLVDINNSINGRRNTGKDNGINALATEPDVKWLLPALAPRMSIQESVKDRRLARYTQDTRSSNFGVFRSDTHNNHNDGDRGPTSDSGHYTK